jgi:hypothetical protein
MRKSRDRPNPVRSRAGSTVRARIVSGDVRPVGYAFANAAPSELGRRSWIQPLRGDVDVRHIDEDRRAYVAAAAAAPLAPVNDPALMVRMFDLRALKLIQTVAAVRDSADTARARALFATEGMAALSFAIGGLLIACLIWHPVFGAALHLTRATPDAQLIGAHSRLARP